MSIHTKTTSATSSSDDIEFLLNQNKKGDFSHIIKDQIEKTIITKKNILQEIQKGVFFLSIKKSEDTNLLAVKKICDRAQYIMLPAHHDQATFGKISLSTLKNFCYDSKTLPTNENLFSQHVRGCHIYFYYHLDYVEQRLIEALKKHDLYVREKLSNRTMIISNDCYNFPTSLGRLAAASIFLNRDMSHIIEHEILNLESKFLLMPDVHTRLKKTFSTCQFNLIDGQILYTHQGLSQNFDYASLIDDIIYGGFANNIDEYLHQFELSDLNLQAFFPTVTVRSPVYIKARPDSLAKPEAGYVIVAAKESSGKQIPIEAQKCGPSLSLWLKRSSRHLFRHCYKARVIFAKNANKTSFSLVGEQIATIAIFPSLIKGVFEALDIPAPKSVRLIAHNEDVLTIAHDTGSWVEINDVNQKATDLFRLVSHDGTDPLSLFQQAVLPDIGAGNFDLRIIPDSFFELIDNARAPRKAMPAGHSHYLLGLAYECLHEWSLAVLEFKKALRLDTQDPEILHALGCALMEIGQVSEAIPFLKRAFDMAVDEPEVANNLGKSSLECGQLEHAIAAFERAVRLSPGSADYLKNLGQGYLLAERHSDALSMLNKALRCDPHSAQAHASLAQVHLSCGDEDLAKKHALLAYKEDPTDTNIADLLWYLTLGKK
jgi:Flp pilus assembly protein TadD